MLRWQTLFCLTSIKVSMSTLNSFSCQKVAKTFGDGGYRSPYLSHAKRALYHLSYVPSYCLNVSITQCDCDCQVAIISQPIRTALLICSLTTITPSIAQLVERWTVVVHCQKSIGRWFKSGSKEFLTNHVTICGHDQSWPLQSCATSQVPR